MKASVQYTKGKGRVFWTPEGLRKSHETNEKLHKARRVTVVCKCGCGRTRELSPSKVSNFYSRDCASRFYSHERKLKRLTNPGE